MALRLFSENTRSFFLLWCRSVTLYNFPIKIVSGTSLAVQRLRLRASTAGGQGLISGRGTKIPQAKWCGRKEKKIILCPSLEIALEQTTALRTVSVCFTFTQNISLLILLVTRAIGVSQTQQFCDTNQVSYNPTQFWHRPPGDSVRPHSLRAQSLRTAPPL